VPATAIEAGDVVRRLEIGELERAAGDEIAADDLQGAHFARVGAVARGRCRNRDFANR
jgi:hypothetical protein